MAFTKDNWMKGILDHIASGEKGRYWHIYPRDTLEGKDVQAALDMQFGLRVYMAFNHGARIVIQRWGGMK